MQTFPSQCVPCGRIDIQGLRHRLPLRPISLVEFSYNIRVIIKLHHQGLDGKTPAEACGIKVEGDNKWITLIQNASHQKNDNAHQSPNK